VRGERLYRALLRAYPADFRDLYGEMMVEFYRERVADAGGTSRSTRLKLYTDVVIHGLRERIAPLPLRTAGYPSTNGERQMLSNWRHDLLYALRSLRRDPAFTATIFATLALGIGANVAIFSVVSGVLLRPLPFLEADRVIQLSNGDSPSTLSEPEVVDLARDARSFANLGAYSYADGNITGGAEAERVRIVRVSTGFFQTLSPTLFLGRVFTADEDRAGAADVVVISYELWQRRFGMNPAAVGQHIILNDVPRMVVGITPPHFDYPSATAAVWTPLRLDRESMVTRNNHYLRVIGRLSPGVTIAAADAEMRTIRDRWTRDFPQSYKASDPLQVDVKPIRDRVVGATQPYLFALLGAVGFVLLIACVNVANLLLARGEVRRKEITIRSALGASRTRIAMQLTLESAILTLGSGLFGIAVAYPALRMIIAAAPGSIPRIGEVHLDTEALLFAGLICVATGVLFALAPIVRGMNVGPLTALNSGARNAVQTGGRAARRRRGVLVVSEVALAVVMLAGAGLFLRTLINLQQTQLGFTPEGVLTARMSLPRPAYNSEKGANFTAALVARARTMPGVTHAAAMAWLPIIDGGGAWSVMAEAAPGSTVAETPTSAPQQVTPGFFATMSIRLLRGRDFTDSDVATSEPVVVVNEAFAKRLWQTDDVLGRKFRLTTNGMPLMTVVGVVANTRVDGLTEPPPPIMYFPHQQARITGYFAALSMSLLVRTSSPSVDAIVPAIKQAVRELDARVPVSDIRTMGNVVASSIARHRFTTLLLGGLAAFAVFLAAIGIYGIIAYSVAQRRYEFGVRMALGAGRGRVLSLVMREGLGVVLVGLAVGLSGVVLLGRVLGSMLVGIGALDGPTFVGVSAILLIVALLALAIPAQRATAIDPTEALRNG
jgi:predicted permease